MTSAVALGHADLRLRSRRLRSGRSHQLSPALVVATIAVASGVGYLVAVGGITRPEQAPAPVVDAAMLQHQQLVADLRPIDAQIQRTIAEEGLLVAAYQSGQIDRAELQRRLEQILTGYQDAANQVGALDLPPALRDGLHADQDALQALTQSAIDLSQAYDDGDQARIAAALGRSLEATARLHALSDDLSPPSSH